jgi:hypothetical protein
MERLLLVKQEEEVRIQVELKNVNRLKEQEENKFNTERRYSKV